MPEDIDQLSAAVLSLDNVTIDPRERQLILIKVLGDAIATVESNGDEPMKTIGGVPADATALRTAAETAYRTLASLSTDRAERISFVDRANQIRPRTMV